MSNNADYIKAMDILEMKLKALAAIQALCDEGIAFWPRLEQIDAETFQISREDIRFLLQFRMRLSNILKLYEGTDCKQQPTGV